METASRRTRAPLIENLLTAPHQFDFFQVVRILENWRLDLKPIGQNALIDHECARIQFVTSSAHSASEVDRIGILKNAKKQTLVTVNFANSLSTIHSPLPPPLFDLLQDRNRVKDFSFYDFSNIFSARMAGILYNLRKKIETGLVNKSPLQTSLGKVVGDLCGVTFIKPNYFSISVNGLSCYADAFWHRPRTLLKFQKLVSDYFGIPTKTESFIGGWRQMNHDQTTKIGFCKNTYNALGTSATLGTRIWDQTKAVKIRLFHLHWKSYVQSIPGRKIHEQLQDFCRLYFSPNFTILIENQIQSNHSKALFLANKPRLGYTSWLGQGKKKTIHTSSYQISTFNA